MIKTGQKQVFLGLGGNIGDPQALLGKAAAEIAAIPQVSDFRLSSFYLTSPVGPIPQDAFVNAACCFLTTLNVAELLAALQGIERSLGKVPKPKNAPRPLDIDILFFGKEVHETALLTVPHPRWSERLFVLQPLSDLVRYLDIPHKTAPCDLHELLKAFTNPHNETVSRL